LRCFENEKERAYSVLKFLERYSRKNNGKAFKKKESIQCLEEEMDESEKFIKKCIKELIENGTLYEPYIGYLHFSRKKQKNKRRPKKIINQCEFLT